MISAYYRRLTGDNPIQQLAAAKVYPFLVLLQLLVMKSNEESSS